MTACQQTTDWKAIHQAILAGLDIAAEARGLGIEFSGKPSKSGWWSCKAWDRPDETPSAGICVESDNGALGRYRDQGGDCKSLSFFELAAQIGRFTDWKEARNRYAEIAGVTIPTSKPAKPKPPAKIVKTYDYRDESGEIVFQVVRLEPKSFRQRKPKPGGGWEWSVKGVRVIPYRLPELLADLSRVVAVAEGEKDADSLARIGVLATCNAGGAEKWTAEHAEFLRGRRVVVLPDNDEKGQTHAQAVAQSLHSIAEWVRVVELPDLPPKGDASDWIAAGGTKAELQRLTRQTAEWQPGEQASPTTPAVAATDEDGEPETPAGRRINIAPTKQTVGEVMHKITDAFLQNDGLYLRAGQPVAIHDSEITTILKPAQLAGALNRYAEVFVYRLGSGGYTPLPQLYGSTWLNHPLELARLPQLKLFTRNPVYTSDWRLVEPGYDPRSGIYYSGESIKPSGDTRHLDALLTDFCFKTPGDRTNYIGMLLTTITVPLFVGTKPAVLFNGNQPVLGKTILAQVIAILRDGAQVETATFNPNDEEFEKRLGAVVRRGQLTIIIDNAKTRGGRMATIESGCLERSITDPILSFRLLGQSAEIRCENSHIFCLTANTAEVSRDIVTRSTVVNLHFEGDPVRRSFTIADPVGYAIRHRKQLLGELVGMVERWRTAGAPMAAVESRFNTTGWGGTIGGILDVAGEPDFLANAGEAATEMDATRRAFAELVSIMVEHPQGTWTAAELTDFCQKRNLLRHELGDGSARSQATRLGIVATRYVAEPFTLEDGRVATFRKHDSRKGNTYGVGVTDNEE